MNLLSPAICETREGDLLILWGGRRIVTRYLDPPLSVPDPLIGEPLERVWRRRYRWDSGPLVLTVISANGTERRDYIAATLARNPAVIDDKTGRVWVGFRVPVISAQDPFGVNFPTNPGYVRPMNIGSTAGMNMWQLYRRKDYALASGAWPFEWQEQLPVLQPSQTPIGLEIPDFSLMGLLQLVSLWTQAGGGEEEGEAGGWDMYTDWTEEMLTGDLYLRGQGGNLMDEENPRRWHWNEGEGLGHTWTAGCLLPSGQQARLSNNQIVVSAKDSWADSRVFSTTFGAYGKSGSLRCDERGTLWVAGHVERDGIPWQVEDEQAIRTVEPSPADVLVWESRWAEDNARDWVIENAAVPAEEYAEGETPPTPEDQAAETARLSSYYYALPTLYDERPGYCISQTGQQFLAWVHGNLTPVPQPDGSYNAVGLRVAVSRDNGRTFEPLIPERIGGLGGAEEE